MLCTADAKVEIEGGSRKWSRSDGFEGLGLKMIRVLEREQKKKRNQGLFLVKWFMACNFCRQLNFHLMRCHELCIKKMLHCFSNSGKV